jgi:amino acid transporter
MQALAELAVMYPVNGAFTMYICRFVDPSWGFACGWQYAISWLTVLPFEISAACNIIHYWPGSEGINNSAWIVPLLVALVAIQIFGVKGYGEASLLKLQYSKDRVNWNRSSSSSVLLRSPLA